MKITTRKLCRILPSIFYSTRAFRSGQPDTTLWVEKLRNFVGILGAVSAIFAVMLAWEPSD